MAKPKVGLVTLASPVEDGADKADERQKVAIESLKKKDLDVATTNVIVSQLEAIDAVSTLDKESIDLMVILHGTWVSDLLQLTIVNGTIKPIILWAIPYASTYSLASVQHLASLMKQLEIPYKYVYGDLDSDEVATTIAKYAKVSQVASQIRSLKIGVIGPSRTTWRVTGPTDTTFDEIDLAFLLGPEIIRLDIQEFLSTIDSISDDEGKKVVDSMRQSGKLGKVEVKEKALIQAAKSYSAIKKIKEKYKLDIVSVKCYPDYPGLVCLASSWLAEEDEICGCEGDVGHSIMQFVLSKFADAPSVLIEPVMIDEETDSLLLRHCGNAPPSLSYDIEKLYLTPVTEESGVVIETVLKPGLATWATLWGSNGEYKMFISTVESIGMDESKWKKLGGGCLASLKHKKMNAEDFCYLLVQRIGVDHHAHIVLKDIREELLILCELMGIESISL